MVHSKAESFNNSLLLGTLFGTDNALMHKIAVGTTARHQ